MRTVGFAIFAALVAAGCGGGSPCDGVSGVCIGAHIKGNATGLEQLVISIDQPAQETVRTPSTPKPIHLPARVALALPAGAGGDVVVAIDGVDGAGQVVAHTERSVSLPASGRVDADFRLDSGTALGDGGVGDDGGDGGGPDMTTGIVIAGAVDQTGYELEPVSISFSATDPEASDSMLTASGVPATATFTPAGADGMLTWTPTLSESGAYPITMTATSASDPTRTGSTPFTLTIKNTIDPVLNPFGISPDQLVLDPVGDVDGDGLADLAFCSTTGQANQLPQYSVQIIYGDKSGLPTARPYPATRTRTVTFSGPAGSSDTFAGATHCVGGDFDGDGKSDVLIVDGAYVPPAGTGAVGSYFIVFGRARDDMAAPATVQLTPQGSDTLAQLPIVGDWNGDGLADFAAVQGNVPNAGPGINANLYIWTGLFPRPTSSQSGRLFSYAHPCGGPPKIVGFAAVDGANGPGGKKAYSLVWYDEAVKPDGTFPGTCASGDGGLRVLTATVQVPHLASFGLHADALFPALPFGICDVDSDGRDDLLVLKIGANNLWDAAVVYGTATGWPKPLDLSKSTPTMVPDFHTPRPACWKSAYGPSAFAVGDPGTSTSNGYTQPGTVWLFDIANQLPVQTKTIANFSSNANYHGFGAGFYAPGDLDGDGKPELMISYQSGTSAPFFAWMLYGR
jgi:hypothetical protein